MSTTPKLLAVADLAVHFPIRRGILQHTVGYVRAVDGVSLELARGRTLALVGESGCGKTTVGKAILQLIQPTTGRVQLDGRELTGLSRKAMRPLRRRLQMIFQDPFASLDPRLPIGEIIGEGMGALGLVQARAGSAAVNAAIAALLGQVGLDAAALHRYPHEFSGGQRQRIAIARALSSNPKVVIADESVSALDVSIQAQIVNLLLDLQKEFGLAFLFISHDMAVVERVSHRVAVMYLGQIVEIGPRRAIFENPQHPYTRKLMDAVPVADPNRRNRDRPLLSDEIPSPVRALGDEPLLAPLHEVGPGHFVARHALSGAF